MNKINIARTLSMANLKLKKHSPEILMAAGVVGIVTSAVMACKATLKVNDILEEMKTNNDAVNEMLVDDRVKPEDYSEEDAKKDRAIIVAQTGIKFVKLYGPAVALGVLSISSILASNNIMRKRNIALAAAYTVVDSSFKDYRARLVERFGEELDRELKYNVKTEQVEEIVVDEKGNESIVTNTVKTVNPANRYSQYARCFTDGCIGHTKDPIYNLGVVRQNEKFANIKYRTDGYLFLNDVYEMFGFPKTPAGQIVGWVYNRKDGKGDGYVDFGIYSDDEKAKDFVNGFENSIWLDFNVDGPIYDLI